MFNKLVTLDFVTQLSRFCYCDCGFGGYYFLLLIIIIIHASKGLGLWAMFWWLQVMAVRWSKLPVAVSVEELKGQYGALHVLQVGQIFLLLEIELHRIRKYLYELSRVFMTFSC